MNRHCYSLELAGQKIGCIPAFPQNINMLAPFLQEGPQERDPIRVGDWERSQYLSQFPQAPWNAYAERKCLLILASDALMEYDRMLFHSAAVLIGGSAFLLSGPSGIGKSTQYRNMKTLFGDRVLVISGDDPVLQFKKDGEIYVHPSPWNGKEDWKSDRTGPLKGLILLKQGSANSLTPLSPYDSVIPVFKQIETYAGTETTIRRLSGLEEKLLSLIPVWEYTNTGDLSSSRILFRHLETISGQAKEV